MDTRKIIFLIALCMAATTARAALTDYELLPAADRQVSSLATVKITFPEAKFLGMYGSQLSGVTLTSKTDPDMVYEPCSISYSTFFSSNSETFSLRRVGEDKASVVSAPGEYVLHFPAGCFDLCGDWYAHLGYSEEINVTYVVGDSGNGYDNYFDSSQVTVRPVPGEIMEFKDITVAFPVSGQYPTIDIIDPDLITMRRTGDDGPGYVITDMDFDGEGTVNFNFRRAESAYPHAEYIFEPGEYTVNIPAGVFRLTSTDVVNEDMTLKYTVTGANAASGQLREFTLTPRAGMVDRIESIILEYPGLTDGFSFPEGITDITPYVSGRITLKRLDKDPYLCSVYEPYSATLMDVNKVELRFRNRVASSSEPKPETITRIGDYQLTVLPNTFKLKTDAFAFNARVEAYYTVSRDMPADPMESFTLSPADGEALGGISSMSIVFPEITEGLEYPIDRTMITLENADDSSDVYEARGIMLNGNKVMWGWNRPEHGFDDKLTIVREGTYRLRIKAGTIREYGNKDHINPEINATYHISPSNDFQFVLTPEPDRAYTGLTEIKVSASGGASDLHPTGNSGNPATLSEASGKSYVLVCSDGCEFVMPDGLPCGNYTLTIPAGYFMETNSQGKQVCNKAITASYRVAEPSRFDASVVPEPGSTVSGLTSVSVTPVGADFRGFRVDRTVGDAILQGDGVSLNLEPSLSQYAVAFLLPDGTSLSPGHYTLRIPAGYIKVEDGNGLSSSLDAIEAGYTVANVSLPAFSGGIFFLNEGAFGSASGSLNYLEDDLRTMHYRVFSNANGGVSPGVTAQFGCIYGDRIYVMSKQASYSDPSSLLTVADAHTLEIRSQVALGGAAGRSVCPIDGNKVYVGTSDGIFVFDEDSGELSGSIGGTDAAAGPYRGQVGDMVRIGRYIFAAAQGRGVYVVDPSSDELVGTIELPEVSGVFVTGGGRLFASSDDDSAPFTEIDPETLVATPVVSEAESVASQWASWRSLPLAADIRGNRVFYVSAPETGRIASFDFDSGVFDAGYITLPSCDGTAMKTYGTSVSTHPETGYVVVAATGGIGKYDRNAIFFADPTDGSVKESLTVCLEQDYWFPAMAVYPVERFPEISSGMSLSLVAGEETALDLAAMTYLGVGNPHLIVYSAVSSDPAVCTVRRTGNGRYSVCGNAEGTACITVTAAYRGLEARSEIKAVVSDGAGIEEAFSDLERPDVFDVAGRCVLRAASDEELSRLPRGFYIIAGKKRFIF